MSILDKARATYRRHFRPEPPIGLDGIAISFMMRTKPNLTWDEARQLRGRVNEARRAAWLRGDRYV